MKQPVLIIILSALFVSQTAAQSTEPADTSWKRGGSIGINFTQVSLSNWSAGGENSVSGIVLFNYFANYLKGKNSWDTNLDLAYGLTQTGDGNPKKSDDKVDFATKYGRQIKPHWYYSALLSFKTQFAKGYDYPNDSVVISNFMAPAYIALALGVDYKPNENFSLFMSPITARYIIVNDQNLADQGAFGVDPAEYDTSGVKIRDGETTRFELGALIKATYKKDIVENVGLSTKLELFSNYLEDPQNIDVNWDLALNIKVSKYITASLTTQLIYDDNTIVNVDNNDDGIVEESGPRTQFKEVIGIGIGFKF